MTAAGLEERTPVEDRPSGGRASGSASRVVDRLFAPVDNASLVAFRIAFGLLLFWEILDYASHGWIADYWIAPGFHFTYLGFGWVQPWPGAWMYLHFAALGSLALCVASGFLYRGAAALFTAGFAYVFLLDKAYYLNHFYLIALIGFLMVLVPAHRRLSLDASLRPEIRSTTAPAWSLYLLRAQVGIVYLYGGIAKLNADWLAGRPMDEWLAEKAGAPVVGPLLDEAWAPLLFSYGGLLLDLLMVPLLLWRRTRAYAFVAAVGFHLANSQLFQIGVFPLFMIAATTLFLSPDWPLRALAVARGRLWAASAPAWLGPRKAEAPPPGPRRAGPPSPMLRRLAVGGLALYLAVQLLVPFRHVLYPGSVHWTEEGHRFSWHMKLRDKRAQRVSFVAFDPRSGRSRAIEPRSYLTDDQIGEMSTRPDMLRQFSRGIAEDLRRRGSGPVQIHVSADVSLNGRSPQPMIDPRADLAAVPHDLRHAPWIVPLAPGR